MRLLIVEDSERLQRSLKIGFSEAGFAVDVTADGLQALELIRSVAYDAVVLDIMIHSLDGLEVLEELRQENNNTHVILLTARGEVDERVKGLQQGADDYLAKPFSFEELLARVQALCRRSYKQKAPEIKVGNFVLHQGNQNLTVLGKTIELLPREYRLLRLLFLRRGEIVSRAEIESRIYDGKAGLLSNAIDSTVSQLRKKLSAEAGNPLIVTRRGSGYMIS